MMSASSIDGPVASSCACSSISAASEKSWSSGCTFSTVAWPPDSAASSAPARKSAMRGVDVQPTSQITLSARTGWVPTSPWSSARTSVELPVDARIEARGEAGGDVGAEDRLGEEDVVEAARLDDLCEHVDARLR